VPGFNDSDEEVTEMARFIKGVSPEIPWHITAFHPDYNMEGPPRTQADQLIRAYDIGKAEGLHFVYPGNLPGMVGGREDTHCPACDATVIRRRGFLVQENRMRGNCCPDCGHTIPGVWQQHAPTASTGLARPRALRL